MRTPIAGTTLALMIGTACAAITAGASGAWAAAAPVLAPHRAVYDLALLRSTGANALSSATGRIVMEITGSACDGYAQSTRQVIEIDGDGGRVRLDHRATTFETGEGDSLRFSKDFRPGQGPAEVFQGTAERRDGATIVRTTVPAAATHRLAEAVFPARHLKLLIEAAREGRPRLEVKLFDGSDEPNKVSETIALIGGRARGGEETLDEPSRKAGLGATARWPVSLSFFDEGAGDKQPTHTVNFEMFDNGVARKLTLDYGDFALKGELTRLEMLKAPACDK